MTHPRTSQRPRRTSSPSRQSTSGTRPPARAKRSAAQRETRANTSSDSRRAPAVADGGSPRRKRNNGGKEDNVAKHAKAEGAKPSDKARLPLYVEPRGSKRSKPSCTACGLCCSYVAIEVDGPATVKQATQLLWYVYHEGVSLYVNDDEWMVQFDSTCVHLQADYRCGVYDTRPHICREFSEKDCEVNTGDDGHTFYTASEFLAYLKQTRPRVHAFVRKHFAPPEDPARTEPSPFERRFQAVLSRRQVLGV